MQSAHHNAFVGYAGIEPTKAPNWHGLIALDMLFNALSTGLFLTAACCELAAADRFERVVRLAYPLALLFLTADLVCLVADLGDPARFLHMLRVFKPSSPMSLGTWSLTVYSFPLVGLVANDWILGAHSPAWLHWLMVAMGVFPALVAVSYKGVLFSTSAQPGWRDARWLGSFHASTAIALGSTQMLVLAVLLDEQRAVETLRWSTGVVLLIGLLFQCLLWSNLGFSMSALASILSAVGLLVALLLIATGVSILLISGGLFVFLANFLVRRMLVTLPHV